jgi:hypothetical protein
MATEKQIAANRRNALKSTGPKSLRGRQNSSRNALKHGVLSKYRQTIPGEDDRAYRGFSTEFEPASPFEVELDGRLVLIHWQQDRDFALHTSIIDSSVEEIRRRMPADDPAWADLGPDEGRLYTRQLALAFYENSAVLCRLATAQSASSRLYTRIVELLWKRRDERWRQAKLSQERTRSGLVNSSRSRKNEPATEPFRPSVR